MQPVAYIGLSWNQRINLLFANTVTHSHCKWMCMRRLSPCIESSCNAVDRLCVLSGWRVVMLKFFIRRSPTSTSFICMKAVFCHSSSPTAASGLSALAKIICWTPGGRRTEPASSRWIKKYFNLLWPPYNRRATDHYTAIRWLVYWPLMGGLLLFGTTRRGLGGASPSSQM